MLKVNIRKEDMTNNRYSYIQDHIRPLTAQGDPELSFFAVYDGHGGTGVANYLKDHLHEFILSQEVDSKHYHHSRFRRSMVLVRSTEKEIFPRPS